MKILHRKLKDIILQIIMEHALSHTDARENAEQGAQDLFDYIRKQINEEIYLLYLAKCQKEFFDEYRFESAEPYVKGLMEARYYIIRMFYISLCEYFEMMEKLSSSGVKENAVEKDRISA
jgi:hypothetical protein